MPEPLQKPGGGSRMSDLKLRVISAAILGPAVLAIAYVGGLWFFALVLVAAVLFQHEWFSITGTSDKSAPAFLGYAALVAACVLYALSYPFLAIAFVGGGALAVYLVGGMSQPARWGAEGIIYSGLALLSLMASRLGDIGLVFVFFLLIVVWATDICAYFVGRFLGGPKLWKQVSPNKTWSGALGGLFFAVLFGVGFAAVFGQTDLLRWGGLAVVLSIVSQAGDLMESAIKRRFDVKDSSGLIPGHGGIMDRVDGLVAAAIMAAALGLAFGGDLANPIAGLSLS
ncbi:phosphatidate cytidylyltransferase [Roseibium polysiphoniae]|uniref:phosphatidate cytidylyltransferase n=1 Tax=Roseibium polysiphoniae TaxID=2571221 RepID=UPI0032980346